MSDMKIGTKTRNEVLQQLHKSLGQFATIRGSNEVDDYADHFGSFGNTSKIEYRVEVMDFRNNPQLVAEKQNNHFPSMSEAMQYLEKSGYEYVEFDVMLNLLLDAKEYMKSYGIFDESLIFFQNGSNVAQYDSEQEHNTKELEKTTDSSNIKSNNIEKNKDKGAEKSMTKENHNASTKQISYAQSIASTLGKKMPKDLSYQSLNTFIQGNMQNYKTKVQQNKEMEKQELHDKIVSGISIVEFAREIGFSPIKKGRYFSLKEHDSVIIDPVKNCFWRNSEAGNGHSLGKGGSVIDFAVSFTNNSMHEILTDFSKRVGNLSAAVPLKAASEKVIKQAEKLVLPEKSSTMKNIFAYLTKTRYIDSSIVQNFVDRKMLFQDNHRNCVFVSYDNGNIDKPLFACLRGTNTSQRFIGDVANSDYEKGFYIDNNSNKLIVTESVIDAMSVMTILKGQGKDWKGYNYLPLAGATKFEALKNKLLESPMEEVLLALDNDKGGLSNIEAIKKMMGENDISTFISEHLPTMAKDWNQELIDTFNKCMSVENIDFLKNLATNAENIVSLDKNENSSFVAKVCKKAAEECSSMLNPAGIGKGSSLGNLLGKEEETEM